MAFTPEERTLSLAGILQAAWLVQQIARTGVADSGVVQSSLETVCRIDTDTVAGVYGGVGGAASGLRQLRTLFQRPGSPPGEYVRYALGLIKLERKLARNGTMLTELGDRIDAARQQVDMYGVMHANVIANLADIYVQTISTLRPRILVNGEPLHLANPDNLNRIRALLLAGIRSAVLWRQCGGSWLQLFFGRRRELRHAERLLANIATVP